MNRHEAICRALGDHIDKRQAADLVDALERLCVLKLDPEPDYRTTRTPDGDALADAGYEVVERQPSLERQMSTKSKA
jgi:hypothetical protein